MAGGSSSFGDGFARPFTTVRMVEYTLIEMSSTRKS